ncbi:hypothetical protein F4604DRAFT_1768502 [Suillus subluteus]|nr:hypothetical protein F4604DRAFT_1768502 [Suillus subluteus]
MKSPTKRRTILKQTDKGTSTKKPRYRHSPNQLAALNELYEKNEHPSLDNRTGSYPSKKAYGRRQRCKVDSR